MSDLKEMPLFPLNTVLFPGMMLPLNIFEPRYKVMMRECMEGNKPFGVVLIKEGVEVGGKAIPHHVGTSAYITQANPLPDGRIVIQTVGYQRFKIHEVRYDRPYLVGIIEECPVTGADHPEIPALVQQFIPRLKAYLSVLQQATDADLDINNIPEDGLALAFFAAITLPTPMEDKQTLLDIDDLGQLLKASKALLVRETYLLDYMIRQYNRTKDMIFSDN